MVVFGMKVYKCRQGHISTFADCPKCRDEVKRANELFDILNEED